MVLWAQVKINSDLVGGIDIQRMTLNPAGGPPADGEICRYRWTVDTEDGQARGEIWHPYGRPGGGWLGLMRAVLERAAEQLLRAPAGLTRG